MTWMEIFICPKVCVSMTEEYCYVTFEIDGGGICCGLTKSLFCYREALVMMVPRVVMVL